MTERESGNRALTAVRDRPLLVVFAAIVLVLTLDLLRRLLTGAVGTHDLATYLWNGAVLGLSIGLAGMGLAMTYSILSFANFAHGDLVTSGAVAGWIAAFLVAGWGDFAAEALVHLGGPFPLNTNTLGISVTSTPVAIVVGLVVAAVATAVLAVVVDRVVYKPMRDQSGISLLIASVGVALAIRYLLVFTFQAGRRGLTAGQQTPSFSVPIGGGTISVNAHQLTLVVVAALLMLGTHLVLRHTKLGTAMRAMADNENLARVTGIPTERVVLTTWLLGGALTGAAGYLIALERGTLTMDFGWLLLLLIFAAVILGGIGSVYGAMVGGIVIGVSSRLSLVWLPESFIVVAAFLVMIAMLLVRPSGLMGGVRTA